MNGKNGLRSTSRILRLASELTWSGSNELVAAREGGEAGPPFVTLQMALPAAALVALTLQR